jgi:uncharacterized YccA/Bax inhibitor family protein
VRESSNPVFRSLPKEQGGYAQFGTGAAGYGAQQVHAQPYIDPYAAPPQAGVARPLTIDDVVTRTGITLAVLSSVAVVSYFLVAGNLGLAMPFTLIGSLGGLAVVMIAMFGRKQDNPAIVLTYAALEGLFLGAISFVLANLYVTGISAGALIGQAILGTLGVFFGMLVVYKTGAIRVTPKFTRFMVGALVGVLVLMVFNLVAAMLGFDTGLRNGGPLAIVFSLVVIGVAAFSLLLDFDMADEAIRRGAPAKFAWYIAFGLLVTVVWLYLEILRLLSYFRE